MEEIDNLITGSFVEYLIDKNEFVDSEEEDEDGGDEDIQWLGYKEVSDMNGGKSFVSYDKPKLKTGELIDIVSRKPQKCRGPILLFKQWWQVTFLRTKVSAKDKYKEPKDRYALCYRLRDDPRCHSDKLANMLISDVLRLTENPTLFNTRMQFEQYLRETNKEAGLDLRNLQEHLETFCERYADPEEEMGPQVQFMNAIVNSGQFCQVKLGQTHPQLLHYLPQVFPFHFIKILMLKEDILDDLVQCIEEEPGNLAFKAILSKRYSVLGVETSKDALIKAGLMSKVPKHEQDAIDIYEYLKTQTKEFGHTWVMFDKIMTQLSKDVSLWDEAMDFLNKHKITKTQMEAGHRIVYLQSLWKAENQITKGLNSLIRKNEIQPWNLEVDFDREDFKSIMADNDQNRAAKLIASQPVCAISGKGGCGKTYVVTQVLTAAQANRSNKKDLTKDEYNEFDDDMTQMQEEDTDEPLIDESSTEKCPDDINILLTAPTGKAANLLGKRAGLSSCTLHQVIWSFRMLKPGTDWKHKDVNILVVDECSLVSVSTMAFLLELLLKNSKLRRIVLLGDIRQLPSIEPGNFLKDTFQSLEVIGFSVELRMNHRAESQAIVDNATAISLKQIPVFDRDKFMFRPLPDNNSESNNGNDYMLQDINDDIIKLLSHESLKSHVNSQFISFTRRVCDAVNDLCCKHYSKHRIKEFKKFIFRTGDKICCSKNGYVNIYAEKHGLMSCSKDATEGQKQEAGGVDRTILTGTANDTMVGQDGNKTLNPEQNNQQLKPTKQIRLCNGEIFFITEEIERQTDDGKMMTFLGLSEDGDHEKTFWVEKRQLRKSCKIRHAWARTIHTFQGSETDHVVYIVGSRSWRQNWQHVYTAVTRGRKTVFIVGQESVLRSAIRRSEVRRQTGLKKQLLQAFQKDKILSPSHAVDSTILCPADKPGPNRLTKTAQWLADCNTASLNTGVNMPSTSRRELNMSGEFNNTQAMTDILSSLASEHDHQHDPEVDDTCPPDYNSDRDSPSLLEQISTKLQPPSIRNKLSNSEQRHPTVNKTDIGDKDAIEEFSSDDEGKVKHPPCVDGEVDDVDDYSDSDSVKSESLLTTPSSTDGYTKLKSHSIKGCETKVDGYSVEQLVKRPTNSMNLKTKQSIQDTISPIIPLNAVRNKVHCNGKDLSPLIPSELSMDQRTLSSTHSSKLSPFTPLTTNNRRLPNTLDHATSSPLVNFTHVKTPNSAGELSFNTSAALTYDHKSTPEQSDIKEPHSNESMWSEVDDSVYLDVTDTNLSGIPTTNSPAALYSNTPGAQCLSSSEKVKNGLHKNSSNYPSDNASPFIYMGRGYLNDRLSKTPNMNNQSTCSQWSEVDEDQYVTALDLADIENMATQTPCNISGADLENMPTQRFADVSNRNLVKSRQSISEPFSKYRQSDVTPPYEPIGNCKRSDITPPDGNDLDSSIIPNTPPEQSTGIKRQLSWNQQDVSPMKRRLATLKFD